MYETVDVLILILGIFWTKDRRPLMRRRLVQGLWTLYQSVGSRPGNFVRQLNILKAVWRSSLSQRWSTLQKSLVRLLVVPLLG